MVFLKRNNRCEFLVGPKTLATFQSDFRFANRKSLSVHNVNWSRYKIETETETKKKKYIYLSNDEMRKKICKKKVDLVKKSCHSSTKLIQLRRIGIQIHLNHTKNLKISIWTHTHTHNKKNPNKNVISKDSHLNVNSHRIIRIKRSGAYRLRWRS